MNALMIVFTCALVMAMSSAVTGYDIDEILSKIPEEERVEFLRYHINLGYTLSQKALRYENAEELPDDFSIQLYEYAKDNHNIQDPDTLKKFRSVICFDDGTCIDIGDIGIHP